MTVTDLLRLCLRFNLNAVLVLVLVFQVSSYYTFSRFSLENLKALATGIGWLWRQWLHVSPDTLHSESKPT